MEKFDLRTQIRNPKTGAVIVHQPYRLHIKSGSRFFERPLNSGHLWHEDGRPAGQMVDGEIQKGMEHKEWKAPLSADQKVLAEISNKDSRIKQLEQQMQDLELKAINAEKEPKVEMKPLVSKDDLNKKNVLPKLKDDDKKVK